MKPSSCLLYTLLTVLPSLKQPSALKKTDIAATATTPTPADPAQVTPPPTAQGSVAETTAHAPSRLEQGSAQHTNGSTAQEDSSPGTTQNVGAMIASTVHGDNDDAVSAQDGSAEDPVTATDPAGVVATSLAAGSIGSS